jgi:purine-cytosine permease-like protein
VKLRYETGIATLIQFITLSLLGIGNGANSIVTTCRHDGTDCISNTIVSLIFFILTVGFFAAIWIIGAIAQEKRSKRFAQLLIAAEAFIALIAAFNARHHTDFLSLLTSLVDLALALWIIILAFRLMRSHGGRVVSRQRPRHRKVS